MKLVYIGENGKRGLKHGQEYEVYIDGSRATVGKRNGFSLVTMLIVYPNTVRLTKDWEVPGEEIRVGTAKDAGEDVATRLGVATDKEEQQQPRKVMVCVEGGEFVEADLNEIMATPEYVDKAIEEAMKAYEARCAKPLKDWTLGEVKEHCINRGDSFGGCALCVLDRMCPKFVQQCPSKWDLTEEPFVAASAEDRKERPRICDILGVEVGERFRIDYPKGMTNWLFIDEDGVIRRENGDDRKKIGNSVAYAVNHPEKIIRKPRFTPEEVERAKAIKVLFPHSETISNEDLIVESTSRLFPSLKDGETVTLDEIVACEG